MQHKTQLKVCAFPVILLVILALPALRSAAGSLPRELGLQMTKISAGENGPAGWSVPAPQKRIPVQKQKDGSDQKARPSGCLPDEPPRSENHETERDSHIPDQLTSLTSERNKNSRPASDG